MVKNMKKLIVIGMVAFALVGCDKFKSKDNEASQTTLSDSQITEQAARTQQITESQNDVLVRKYAEIQQKMVALGQMNDPKINDIISQVEEFSADGLIDIKEADYILGTINVHYKLISEKRNGTTDQATSEQPNTQDQDDISNNPNPFS